MTTTTTSVGSIAKWNAWSHRLMGEVSVIDSLLTTLLALADARSAEAAERLAETYAQVPLTRRADLLKQLPDRPGYVGVFEIDRVADWVKRLSAFRNQIAHATILQATPETALLYSFYRGRGRETRVWRGGMEYAHKMARATVVGLRELLPACADLKVWGRMSGFDEGAPQGQEVSL